MWNLTCPYCGQSAFRWWLKVVLGPARTLRCTGCGKEVGVSMYPALAGVVLFIAYVLVAALPESPMSSPWIAGGVIIGIVLVWATWLARSPLTREEERRQEGT